MDRSKWEYKKLGDICDKGSSNIAQNKIEDNTGDYALYGASGYVKGIDFYHQEQPYIGVVKDGSGVGRVNKYPAKSSLLGTMQYIFPKECCDLGYLLYVLQGLHLEKYKTGAAIPHIYFKDYCKCEVPFPSIADQQRIVAELDCLNEMIAVKQEQLKEFDKLAQSIFYDMFGKLDAPQHTLKDVLSKMGSGATPSGGNQSYKTEGTSLIRSLNVHNNEFVYTDLAFIDDEQARKLDNVIIEENDVLLNITGASVARCCIVPSNVLPARVNQHVSILRTKSDLINNTYLCHLLISKEEQTKLIALSKSKAATREALPKNILEKYLIPLPPLSLQQEFADKISAIEAQKELVKQSIAETQALLDYTMDKYFG